MSGPTHIPSDTWLAQARKLTELPGINELNNAELLALVGCAEELLRLYKGYDLGTRASAALKRLEVL
jgi:hypothetical protein